MNNEIDFLYASDGTGEAVRAVVTGTRSIASTTLEVDSLNNWPAKFVATVGTLNGTTGIIDPATVTIFKGHTSGGDIIIDEFAPGYADAGNSIGQVVVLKPNTFWADLLAETIGSTQAGTDITGVQTGRLGEVEYFTSSGTWTKPANLKFVVVEVQAAGGGGGGSSNTDSSVGAGGGGGGYAKLKILAASLSGTETVTVGAGGTAGTATGSGGNGGTSSFGSHLSTGGGGLGGVGSGSPNGGTGGTATGGDMNIPGDAGGAGGTTGTAPAQFLRNGFGGSGFMGSVTLRDANGGTVQNGDVGRNYGSGGSGGYRNSTNSAPGGAGAPGIVIVHEYF